MVLRRREGLIAIVYACKHLYQQGSLFHLARVQDQRINTDPCGSSGPGGNAIKLARSFPSHEVSWPPLVQMGFSAKTKRGHKADPSQWRLL